MAMDTTLISPSLAGVILTIALPLLCTYACFSDMFSMRISNRLSLAVLSLFPVFALSIGMGWTVFGWHMLAGLMVLTVTFGLFAAGFIGGGDAKLTAALAVWIGFGQLVEYLVLASVFGGALTVGILFLRQHPLPAFAARQSWIMRLHDSKSGVPYGIALGVAALVLFPHSAVWKAII
jgi:prepilin peptidase CpaA